MDEFALIRTLARATAVARPDVVLGIGDDAALLAPPRGARLALATDTLVAGVHFPRDTAPAAIGWKALAVNLSDLAAMGAEPAWATLALTLPAADPRWIAAFARGFARLARQHRVALVGGDTTRGPLTISVQVAGFVPPARALRRDGARAGDWIYVSGVPGEAAAGLRLRRARAAGRGARAALTDRQRRALIARLEYPRPRVALGLALRGVASAAIDVSDGLLQDLGHVLAASGGLGARIELAALPSSAALRAACPQRPRLLRHVLAGGDDYELVFTLPPARAATLERRGARLGVALTRIGVVTGSAGIEVVGGTGRRGARFAGWDPLWPWARLMRLDRGQRALLLGHPAGWIASVGGVGLAPRAPGTVGSALALLPWWWLAQGPWWLPWLAILAGFALGVWASAVVIRRMRCEDPGVVVIDEFVGQWLTLALVDLALRHAPWPLAVPSSAALLLVAFIAFRLCDIAKPWPVRWADRRLSGGFGAMADDALAACGAAALVLAALVVAARLGAG